MKFTTRRLTAALLSLLFVTAACGAESTDSADSSVTTSGDPTPTTTDDSATTTDEVMDHDDHHDHDMLIEAGASPPSLVIEVTNSDSLGWALGIEAQDFTFMPESVTGDSVVGEGHAHVYVDGAKVGRAYGTLYPLELTAGTHDVMVEFATINHEIHAIDGEKIRSMVTVEVSADDANAVAIDSGAVGIEIPDADTVVLVTVADGNVTTENDRVKVDRGSSVAIVVDSDVADEIHVHGVNLFGDVMAGTTSSMLFTPDVSGVFEVELENSGKFLFELEVS